MIKDTLNVLIEIGVEELPTKAVNGLSQAGKTLWEEAFKEANLSFSGCDVFATPRRLAWRFRDLLAHQPDQEIVRKGPALAQAKDASGNWTKAALGFAASCGVSIDDLRIETQGKNEHLMFYGKAQGKALAEILPELFAQVMSQLPIAKRMRWASFDQAFVRPVNTLLVLADDTVLPLDYFGVKAGNQVLGHRVHHPDLLTISHANDYESALEKAYVIADPAKRQEKIRTGVRALAASLGGEAVMPEALVEEVASLTEWPVPLSGSFDEAFLQVPQECLITTLQDNQKTFAVVDKNGKLLPHFVAVANLESRNPEAVSKGNEKVIRPRFADAQFFWAQDLKHRLSDYLPRLEKVVYQEKLGSLADKSRRLQTLVQSLAQALNLPADKAMLAAELSKCDLQTEMVMEFPELQGIMGRYYAQKEGLDDTVAHALEEQYYPVGAGSALPSTKEGMLLSMAEKLDTLIGGFAIGAKPTGSKDPYALRRMAIGLIRLIIENQLTLSLKAILTLAANTFPAALNAQNCVDEVDAYIAERLNAYFKDLGFAPALYQAVRAQGCDDLLDVKHRMQALQTLLSSQNSGDLLASAKRIRNILRKNPPKSDVRFTPSLLQETAEKALWQAFEAISVPLNEAMAQKDYLLALNILNTLGATLSQFFADVMVMAEDESIRNNRLALLNHLQEAMDRIADLSLLEGL